ncbi:MAG: class I tRNA ligase family protein, partial [bacterium]|nr:class I tRNA ligase family protein [bacterium]
LVIAPEHPLIFELTTGENRGKVEKYIEAAAKKSELERMGLSGKVPPQGRDARISDQIEDLEKFGKKTGVFSGSYATNPANGEKIPVWVGDYVIAAYGGGAVMVVPAHDKRDYDFAQKYNLPIKKVILPKPLLLIIRNAEDVAMGAKKSLRPEAECFTGDGELVNSGQFSGLTSEKAREEIIKWLESRGLAKRAVHYHLRDWIFSRQHYWGEPIPLIFCENCARNHQRKSAFSEGEILNPGWIAIPEKDLPVELPYVKKYQPTGTGESPLAAISSWVNTKCPKCGGPARRETDTMPNWAGSSWYFLRYIDPKNDRAFADFKKLEYWLAPARRLVRQNLGVGGSPKGEGGVDLYNGGMEHTTLHLLYSRFWHKFLFDLGLVPTEEPYQRRRSHGVVLAEDGQKMSKSRGNVINPDEIIKNYGADTLRIYEMFMGPFDQTIIWSANGLLGCFRFLGRVWDVFRDKKKFGDSSKETKIKLHQLIKKVGGDLQTMKFNTAIAAFMEFINLLTQPRQKISKEDAGLFLKILAPFAPHFSEELWQKLGNKSSIHLEKWPEYDEVLIKEETIILVVQINGVVRDRIETAPDISETEAKKIAFDSKRVKQHLAGKKIKKIIYVPGKLINFVV